VAQERFKNQQLKQEATELKEKIIKLEYTINDNQEQDEARDMQMQYFKNLLEEKENEIKELKDTIEMSRTSEFG
jgi:septal ring factor EnvC (AmiA/AmiB activator)